MAQPTSVTVAPTPVVDTPTPRWRRAVKPPAGVAAPTPVAATAVPGADGVVGSKAQQQIRTAQDLFIRRWGEMGQTWGINRTMAEIHAFLYITGQPQCTDDVMERLNISRGNASMSLRALCDWGIIRRLHRRGERREYFESLSDVWEIFSIIAAERKRREMDPVLETIKQCQRMLEEPELGKAAARSEAAQMTRQRLKGMQEFVEVTNKIFAQFVTNARGGLNKLVTLLLKAL